MNKNNLNSKEYWKKREEQKLKKGIKDCNKLARDLEIQYKSASQYIEKEINNIFEKYSKDNNLTYSEATKYLNSNEYKVWRADIKGYLEMIEADEKVLLELNTLSAKSRITRWEALKSEVDKSLINLNKKALKSTTELLKDTLVDNYNTNAFNISKAMGFVANLAGIDEKMIEKVLSYPWSGKDYKLRILDNTVKLSDVLKEEMTQMIIRGEDSKAITSRISQRVQSNYKETMRLVQTEHSYIMSQANMMTYKELEVERYEFLATLDEKTCKICGELDGENFPVKEAQAGENQAPMHPNCRCTEIAYFDDDEDDGERFARLKNGKKIEVSAKMTYEEFKKEYLD